MPGKHSTSEKQVSGSLLNVQFVEEPLLKKGITSLQRTLSISPTAYLCMEVIHTSDKRTSSLKRTK